MHRAFAAAEPPVAAASVREEETGRTNIQLRVVAEALYKAVASDCDLPWVSAACPRWWTLGPVGVQAATMKSSWAEVVREDGDAKGAKRASTGDRTNAPTDVKARIMVGSRAAESAVQVQPFRRYGVPDS